ncbi:MAG: DNA translocase FtsK 4TM domain-containing protein [Acidobacteriota bacterium]|nr:DNA translocase FtsK 4TM domain-containing protein [Acidobacteriota bacterium]
MARSEKSERISEFVGVGLFALGLLWLISLATHSPEDPVMIFINNGTDNSPANYIGELGAFLSYLSFQSFGYAAFLIPGLLSVLGWHYFWCLQIDAIYTKYIGILTLLTALASFLSIAFDFQGGEIVISADSAGGVVGSWLAANLVNALNRLGSIIFILTLCFLSIFLSTQASIGRSAAKGWDTLIRCMNLLSNYVRQTYAKFRQGFRETNHSEKRAQGNPLPAIAIGPTAAMIEESETDDQEPADSLQAPPQNGRPSIKKQNQPASSQPLPPSDASSKASAERRNGDYVLPALSLLDSVRIVRKIDDRELMEGARLLTDKCKEFNVEGNVDEIHPGPVVTTYEFKPEAGVKYSKVTGLTEDLCLAMQANSVLIDRIPGKSTVGIQIPNRTREQISLRELLESDSYKRSTSKLTMALGKTIHGEPFVADLATMPHLLIAGATGAGKSVSVNAMITSMLYRATPRDVRFIMIDPKRLELGMYQDVPHLLTPVVVDPKQASNALRWAVREMEERYKLLAANGVRNIDQYNRNANNLAKESKEESPEPLPYIVVVIDELADLMMVASNEVEESIARLAQMARAVGIHLILATQRPSVDVITGLIKANLPARISFQVASKIDSRTILDGNGAEQLLGMGDMLFMPPTSSRVIRLHGPYISEQESSRLASFLRKQAQPIYDKTITEEEKKAETIEFDRDTLYDEASRIIVTSGQASISFLQRRLRIGFSRAARLVDMMESEGLVSAGGGGKAREVLVSKDYFDEIDAQLR